VGKSPEGSRQPGGETRTLARFFEGLPGGRCVGGLACDSFAPVVTVPARCSPLPARLRVYPPCTACSGPVRSRTPPALRSSRPGPIGRPGMARPMRALRGTEATCRSPVVRTWPTSTCPSSIAVRVALAPEETSGVLTTIAAAAVMSGQFVLRVRFFHGRSIEPGADSRTDVASRHADSRWLEARAWLGTPLSVVCGTGPSPTRCVAPGSRRRRSGSWLAYPPSSR